MARELKKVKSIGVYQDESGAWKASIHYVLTTDDGDVEKAREVALPAGFVNAAVAQMRGEEGL